MGFDLNDLHHYVHYGPMGTQNNETTSISATPATVTLDELGDTQQITVVNQAAVVLTQYLTYSSNNAKTTVSASGLITSVATGTSTITVTYSQPEDLPLTDTIAVTNHATNEIIFAGVPADPFDLHVNTTTPYYSLYVTNQYPRDITYECDYASSDEAVATVLTLNGTITFLTAGTTDITATAPNGVSGLTTVNVTNNIITSLVPGATAVTFTYTGETNSISIDDQLVAPIDYALLTMTSSDDLVATVDAAGLVTATGVGTCTITYELTADPLIFVDVLIEVTA